MVSRKRIARAMPFVVLFGAVIAGLLSVFHLAPPAAFHYAMGGVVLFFGARWFSRNMRKYRKYMEKESPAQRRDRRRAFQKAAGG